MARTPRLEDVDLDRKLDGEKAYLKRLKAAQLRLLDVQQAYIRQGHKAIIALEGLDAAGKGGLIRRLTERLDPRAFQVWPIAKPPPHEAGVHWLYRFWRRLPEPGSIAIFDRSWYGRVLVERVEGLAPKEAWKRAYREINEFEDQLIAERIRVIKIFLHASAEVQIERFLERMRIPHKRWKITAEDFRNFGRRDDYLRAIDDMLRRTHTKRAPWHVVPSDYRWYSRVAALEIIADGLAKGVDLTPPELDPKMKRRAAQLARSLPPDRERR